MSKPVVRLAAFAALLLAVVAAAFGLGAVVGA